MTLTISDIKGLAGINRNYSVFSSSSLFFSAKVFSHQPLNEILSEGNYL